MTARKDFIIILLLLLSFKAFSQYKTNLEERGTVVSSAGNIPIEGATIIFYPANNIAVTNESGIFYLQEKFKAPDSILISVIGYESKNISYEEFIKNNKIISLSPRAVELETVTISSNRGGNHDHISRIDVLMRDVTNSQEVLRLVPGLFIGQHAGGGKAEQLFMRGFDLDHGTDINISVDGIPVNMVSHAHGQGYADLHFLIPELIEQVNFKKGPYFPEKGNLATAGYVEFRTKKILADEMIKMEAGQFNSYRTVAMIDLLKKERNEKRSAFIASEYMYSGGYFENPQHFKRLNVFGKYIKKINENNDIIFSASAFRSRWKASGQVPERAVQNGWIGFFGAIDPDEGGNTGRVNMNVQLNTNLKDNYLKNQVYFTKYDFELYSNFTFFLNDSVNGDQVRQKEKRDLFGYNGIYSHAGYVSDKKITTEAGINTRFDKTNDSELSRTKNRAIVTDSVKLGDVKELNAGIWVNETIQWNEKLDISAGIRYDYFQHSYLDKLNNEIFTKRTAGIISPKLNFYYRFNNSTQLYFTTGKGFHSNDTRVAVQEGGRKTLPAAYGADIGIIMKPVKNLFLQSAIWYLKLDQEFVYVGDEGVVEPGGQSKRLGVDFSIRYQPAKWLYFDFDANYSKGRAIDQKKGKDLLPLAPVFTSIGGITYKSDFGLNAGFRYRFMSDRPANEMNSVVAKGYFVADAAFIYTCKKFGTGFSIQNLFNVKWKETQFDTESKLRNETVPVSGIHFTPGTPLFFKIHFSVLF